VIPVSPGLRFCKLCGQKAILFHSSDTLDSPFYWRCPACGLVFLDPTFYPSGKAARERYLFHDNSLTSPGYAAFLERFIETCILPFVPVSGHVLDFGSGPQRPPLISSLLSHRGYVCDSYDPIFAPSRTWRKKSYACILLHEVAEHLSHPKETFITLSKRLVPGGILAVRTRFPPSTEKEFASWWYKMDFTHLAFYPPESLELFLSRLGFQSILCQRPDSMVFKAP